LKKKIASYYGIRATGGIYTCVVYLSNIWYVIIHHV